MYYIVSYDVQVERCSKIMKILRKYLFHIHNSVFEGELTNLEYENMKKEVNNILANNDSIIFYQIVSKKALKKEGNKFGNNIIII